LVIKTEKGFKAEGRRQKAEVLKPLCCNYFGIFIQYFLLPSALCLLPYPNPDHQKLPRTLMWSELDDCGLVAVNVGSCQILVINTRFGF